MKKIIFIIVVVLAVGAVATSLTVPQWRFWENESSNTTHAHVAQLQQRNTELSTQVLTLQGEIARLSVALADHENDIGQTAELIITLQSHIESLSLQIANNNVLIISLSTENAHLQMQIATMEKAIAQQEQLAHDAANLIASLTTQLGSLNIQITDQNALIEELINRIAELENSMTDMRFDGTFATMGGEFIPPMSFTIADKRLVGAYLDGIPSLDLLLQLDQMLREELIEMGIEPYDFLTFNYPALTIAVYTILEVETDSGTDFWPMLLGAIINLNSGEGTLIALCPVEGEPIEFIAITRV